MNGLETPAARHPYDAWGRVLRFFSRSLPLSGICHDDRNGHRRGSTLKGLRHWVRRRKRRAGVNRPDDRLAAGSDHDPLDSDQLLRPLAPTASEGVHHVDHATARVDRVLPELARHVAVLLGHLCPTACLQGEVVQHDGLRGDHRLDGVGRLEPLDTNQRGRLIERVLGPGMNAVALEYERRFRGTGEQVGVERDVFRAERRL